MRSEIVSRLWKVLIAGVASARFAFVGLYFDSYKSAPWSILDIRDGGFSLPAGIAAALLMAVWVAWRRRDVRKSFKISADAGAAVWEIGMLAMMEIGTATVEMPLVML